MDQDTPEVDRTARTIAENIYAGYRRLAAGAIHPQVEQTILTRLIEAIRPEIPSNSPGAIIAAANATLDAFEQVNPEMLGPRVGTVDRADGSVGMKAVGA